MRAIEPSETPFRIGIAAVALLLIVGMIRLRFCGEVELPELPARPEPPRITPAEVTRAVERSPEFYAEYLGKDAKAFGIEPAPTLAEMGRALPYQAEDVGLVLDPSDKHKRVAEALGLRFSLAVEKIEGTPNLQMVLAIENTTERALAYRVVTRPSKGNNPCTRKREVAHNAVALAPGATERRSECLWNKGWTLKIDRVELIDLPPLAFHYVSLLPADKLGLDPRTARSHRSPDREPLCRLFHTAEIDNAIASRQTTWRDLIDFYARHRCKTYIFPNGYKAIDEGTTLTLPVVPERG